jgi:TetR/AcrR family transcriptional regulator, transcriptional repressor for nem operon
MSAPKPSTRDRILQAAIELFWAHGYAGTGMAEILKKADANSGSFYFFFTSKEDLLMAVLEWYQLNLGPVLLEPVFKQSKDPIRRIFLLLEKYRQNVLMTEFAFGCPLGRLALEIEPDRRQVHDKIAANFTGWARAVEELLTQAVEGGRLSKECQVRQLSRFVLTAMEGAVMQARSYQCIEPFDDCIAQLRSHFQQIETLAAGKGRQKKRTLSNSRTPGSAPERRNK